MLKDHRAFCPSHVTPRPAREGDAGRQCASIFQKHAQKPSQGLGERAALQLPVDTGRKPKTTQLERRKANLFLTCRRKAVHPKLWLAVRKDGKHCYRVSAERARAGTGSRPEVKDAYACSKCSELSFSYPNATSTAAKALSCRADERVSLLDMHTHTQPALGAGL